MKEVNWWEEILIIPTRKQQTAGNPFANLKFKFSYRFRLLEAHDGGCPLTILHSLTNFCGRISNITMALLPFSSGAFFFAFSVVFSLPKHSAYCFKREYALRSDFHKMRTSARAWTRKAAFPCTLFLLSRFRCLSIFTFLRSSMHSCIIRKESVLSIRRVRAMLGSRQE